MPKAAPCRRISFLIGTKKHCHLLSVALLLAGAAHAQSTGLFFSEYSEVPTSQRGATATGPRLRRAAPSCFMQLANQSIVRRPTSWRGWRVPPAPQNVPGSNLPVRNPGGYNIAHEWTPQPGF